MGVYTKPHLEFSKHLWNFVFKKMIWMLVLEEEVNLLIFTPHFNRGGGNTIPTELYYEEMHAFDSHPMIFWDSGKERKKKTSSKAFLYQNNFRKQNPNFIHQSIKLLKTVTKLILKFKASSYKKRLYPYPKNILMTTKLHVLNVLNRTVKIWKMF